MAKLQALRSVSLPQQIAEIIYTAAARGLFLPNEKLVEVDLAQELGVSRVPVREALRLLESQGLVVSEPYKGMRLMPVSTRDCRERFRIYRALALEALHGIAALPPDPGRWQRLRVLAAATAKAGTQGDPGAALKAIATFFDAYFATAQNVALVKIVRSLNIQFAVYGSLFSSRESLLEQQHLARFVEHGEAGNFAAAEEALRRYLDPDQVGDVEAALGAAWERRRTVHPTRRVQLNAAPEVPFLD